MSSKGCLSYLDEMTSVIANLFAIADHIIILMDVGFNNTNPDDVSTLFSVPIDFETHAFITGIAIFIGMSFANKKIWEILGERELSWGWMFIGWIPLQMFSSLFVLGSWWLIFRIVLGFTGALIASLPAFLFFFIVFIVITGVLGLILQTIAWSPKLL